MDSTECVSCISYVLILVVCVCVCACVRVCACVCIVVTVVLWFHPNRVHPVGVCM